jgi:hypothetical protein
MPVALAVGLALREAGILAPDAPLPTSVAAALAALRSGLATGSAVCDPREREHEQR